jgi:hypothetical protein
MSSVKYKHYTHEEIRKAREEVIHAFASVVHISKVVLMAVQRSFDYHAFHPSCFSRHDPRKDEALSGKESP